MRFLSGYVGCALIFILLMGLVLHSFVLPTINRRKKHFVEWLTILFFGLGVLRSMAVKPDGGNASQSPRRSPMGFYNYDPLLDLLIAYPTLTNDWQWITSQAVASSATNCTFTVTPSTLGLTELPPHPVLLSGPRNGYTVIKSTADLGAFMFKDGQDSHTLVRNIYLDLLKCGNFQVGFWCGGNLPNDFNDYIGNGYKLPMLMLDQDEHAIVADVSFIPTGRYYSAGSEPSN